MPFKLGCCLTWKKQQDHGFSIKRPSPKILEESSLQLCNPTLFQDIIWKSNESRQESPWSRSRSCSDSSITRWFTIINFYKTLRIILNRNKTIHTIIIFRWINIESFLQEYFLNFIQIHEINKLHTYSYEKKGHFGTENKAMMKYFKVLILKKGWGWFSTSFRLDLVGESGWNIKILTTEIRCNSWWLSEVWIRSGFRPKIFY